MRNAICFRDLKAAALYFDRVLPVAFGMAMGTGTDTVTMFPEPIPSRALINMVFDKKPVEGAERYRDYGRIIDGWDEFAKSSTAYWPGGSSSTADYGELANDYLRDRAIPGQQPLRRLFAQYASSLGIARPDVLLPSSSRVIDSQCEDPIVRLSQLSIIDSERATWEQVQELRSDSESRVKLHRLRAFAETNYLGKSAAFIEDDLSSKIGDYEIASRKHGFDLVAGSLATLLDARNLQVAVGASLAAAIIGGPIAAASAAACLEFGKFALEFAKKKREMDDWASGHPLAHLIEIRSLAQRNP